MPTAVMALGGNALLPKRRQASIDVQFETCRNAIRHITTLLRRGMDVVFTHGNGRQVGNILLQSEAGLGKAYPVTLGVAVAETEGGDWLHTPADALQRAEALRPSACRCYCAYAGRR